MKKLTISIGILALAGCAHTQAAKTETTGGPAVAQKQQTATPAPQPQSQDNADLEALLRGTVIHFDFNEDVLTPDSRTRLQKIGDVMRKNGEQSIKIAGNCDERGTEEYNIALGQRRAEVAKKYLVSLGVDAAKIDTVSYGKERPAAQGHDENAWAQNRRDEFEAR